MEIKTSYRDFFYDPNQNYQNQEIKKTDDHESERLDKEEGIPQESVSADESIQADDSLFDIDLEVKKEKSDLPVEMPASAACTQPGRCQTAGMCHTRGSACTCTNRC